MVRYLWKVAIVIIGAISGYAYYHFIGCRSGTCPITSNAYISTGYGALFGFVLAWSNRKKSEDQKTGER